MQNEATARIKINDLLRAAGWRFFDDESGPANISLELNTKIKKSDLDEFGNNFEKTSNGFIDFLLLDERGRPLVVLEAKSEELDPMVGKEQARKYARSKNCHFVILSNGNLHYFWDLRRGNPNLTTQFPSPESVTRYEKVKPDSQRLIKEPIGNDYIALTQRPNYASEAGWKNETERDGYIKDNNLRFLRDYQLNAVHALQRAVKADKDRFLFEMATGTGKTLTTAAVIKLFLRSGNVRRVLFLVDRLELEEQARKVFKKLLSNDYRTVIYKENRNDWRHAEIVVSTVQSLLFNNKYQRLFSPTDFDLVISDEAHRSIGGNARSVFEYFVGYKLGLTATPKDYLKNFDPSKPTTRNPREAESRLLYDTYRTFGCESSEPTFRYSLQDGVKNGFLISPIVVDAQTQITTELLSEQGFIVNFEDEAGEIQKGEFSQKDFEKRFISEATNEIICKAFLQNALRDPVSNEIGKTIIFAVSQNHALKLAQILNEMADKMFPNKYESDFAVQVTSQILNAQQFTINFTNNNLLGNANFIDAYKTSKARVCVTVGMMTTGYDCPDILNIGMFRPIFSPTDFIQIKGRGTRKHNFLEQLRDDSMKGNIRHPEKKTFKIFDFFKNYRYFEEDFNYDEVLKLPIKPGNGESGESGTTAPIIESYVHRGPDSLVGLQDEPIGYEGMRIDRRFFEKFENTVRDDQFIKDRVEAGKWDEVIDYVNREVFDKPEEYYSLKKLREAASVDRRITIREILEYVFGFIPGFKSKNELLEEEFAKFISDHAPEKVETIPAIKTYFKAYITSDETRIIIEKREYGDLVTNPAFTRDDFLAVPSEYRSLIPEYVKDYVPLNQFAA